MSYAEFIRTKFADSRSAGIDAVCGEHEPLFPHQRALTNWALKRGRAAIFADTGLGKTRMQLEWAKVAHEVTGHDVLILAPLAVAQQTAAEGESVGIPVALCRDDSDTRSGISITNYDRLHRFDPARFGAVVLDESSCIKHHDTKTLAALLIAFRDAPYKLCATATPAPNDWTELGTHAEFLGVRSRAEMLAEFFVHDGAETQVWRLKGHARQAFWRWVASWGAMVRSPADLGFDASMYQLPPLSVRQHMVQSDQQAAEGSLFALEASRLSERRDARRGSLTGRVAACAGIVNGDPQPWVVWCDLNAEGDALRQAIPGSVEIRGSDDPDTKENRLQDFAAGRIRVLITKPSIAGFGLNWQHCARMAFVGVTDSWEAYYQAVRRCWRFGQTRPVDVHIFASELEGAIVANLQRKERDAALMADALAQETLAAVRQSVLGAAKETDGYKAGKRAALPVWMRSAA